MKNRVSAAPVAAVVAAVLTTQVQAAGYQLAEYSATGLGRAFAGEAAMADNASAQGRNAALLMQLKGQQFSVGAIYVDPNIDIDGQISLSNRGSTLPVGSGNASDIAPAALIPNFYYSNRLNDQWAVGVSLNALHGMATELPSEHPAAIFGSDTSIETIEFAPAVAYQLSEQIALGAALRVVYGDGNVKATVPGWAANLGLPAGETLKSVDGDGLDFGYQLGATWQLDANHRIGLNYRSEIELTLEGDAEGLAYGLQPGQTRDGELVLPLPATAELASFHQITERFALHASINWTEWSTFESLTVDFPEGPSLLKEENFEDNWRYALGGTYKASDAWTLRGGVALDKGAVSDEHRTLSIPDSDRLWFSFGAGYRWTPDWTLDLAVTYIKADDASINECVALTGECSKPITSTLVHYDGELNGDVWLAGAQASYRF